uniref:Putative secreted protein n=1 Tax=Anopheles darlingi TaxID=43151 RepID=A0A2M4DAN7_ANODA
MPHLRFSCCIACNFFLIRAFIFLVKYNYHGTTNRATRPTGPRVGWSCYLHRRYDGDVGFNVHSKARSPSAI